MTVKYSGQAGAAPGHLCHSQPCAKPLAHTASLDRPCPQCNPTQHTTSFNYYLNKDAGCRHLPRLQAPVSLSLPPFPVVVGPVPVCVTPPTARTQAALSPKLALSVPPTIIHINRAWGAVIPTALPGVAALRGPRRLPCRLICRNKGSGKQAVGGINCSLLAA
jgi:hypothetical protein